MRRASISFAVLGDGGWGTTLALHLHGLGHPTTLWGAFPEHVAALAAQRENMKFLPGVRLPRSLGLTANLAEAVGAADIIVLAVPSQYFRSVIRRLPGLPYGRVPPLRGKAFLSVVKGLEPATGWRMSEVMRQELGRVPVAVLSGPNVALEIAGGQPAISVIASANRPLALTLQRLMMNERLRLYTSSDVAGVELGGALKNSIAIAAGIGDGLGFGSNAKAAIISRGLVEMARLGSALGARPATFWGISGLGDLITTCLGGRNRWFGEQIGKGRRPAAVLAGIPTVIEGVNTTKAALTLARRVGVELPIIEQVYAVLFERKTPHRALRTLMLRTGKAESLFAAEVAC